MACGSLTRGAKYNCADPLQGGSAPNVTLINADDVLGITISGTTPNLITDIDLVSGASAYSFEGYGRSVTPQQEVITLGSGQNVTKHQVGLFIFDDSQDQKNNIQAMLVGRYVAIVEKIKKNSNTFSVYGLGNGLELQPGVINQLNENNGAYNIVLATPANQGEALLPQTLFTTDYATTKALVTGLLYLPGILNLSVLAVAAAGGTSVIVTGLNFFGGGAASAITSIKWVNQSTLAEVTQTIPGGVTNTSMTLTTPALTAGTYKLKIVTSKGEAYSVVNVISS